MAGHDLRNGSLLTALLFSAVLLSPITAAARSTPASYRTIRFDYNTERRGGDYTHFRSYDFENCAEACVNDSRCRAMEFDITNNMCWLKDRVSPPGYSRTIASGVKIDSGNIAPSPPGREEVIDGVRITRNVFRNGGDYTNFTVRNMKQCARACAEDSRCRSFNFGRERRDCWLKNTIPAGTPHKAVISGYKDNSGSGGYYPPEQEEVLFGMRISKKNKRAGRGYTSFPVRNLKECARTCSREYQCRSFNYEKRGRNCQLLSDIPVSTHDSGVISGVKKQ